MATNNVKICTRPGCGHRKGQHHLVERAHKGPCFHERESKGDVCPCTKYQGP